MSDDVVIAEQLEFYRRGGVGCLFAAHAAMDPAHYGWRFSVADVSAAAIDGIVASAIENEGISTQSVIFPGVNEWNALSSLLETLTRASRFLLGQDRVFQGSVCLGYRVRLGADCSYVTGFGPFDFLPKTRRAPFTEIVFRSKPRPPYKEVMKEAPEGVVHLADMDMQGMGKRDFTRMWGESFAHVKAILGQAPDLRSAAKTTFAVPERLWAPHQ